MNKSGHDFRRVEQPVYRSGYGNMDYRDGTAYYALCTCGRWFALANGESATFAETLANHRTEEEADRRGFDIKEGFFICRFDRTVTDDMDAHDRVCTGRDKR